jgi:hypothetical protein
MQEIGCEEEDCIQDLKKIGCDEWDWMQEIG